MTEPLSENDSENFDRFIVEAIENGCVWSLQGPEGWALCGSEKYENTDVMPFWSKEDFARVYLHCKIHSSHQIAPTAHSVAYQARVYRARQAPSQVLHLSLHPDYTRAKGRTAASDSSSIENLLPGLQS
ncbi:MAG: DUF2750 domain-containing protein [Moraxellaceae bacterium]|nr:MAG: DUF2750 domain-containing protein [Moraxellaceae bacterium]